MKEVYNFINLKGKKFGIRTVIKREKNNKGGGAMWLCRCKCGSLKIVSSSNLINSKSKSCGCLNPKGKKHYNYKYGVIIDGKVNKLYYTWRGIIERCNNKNRKDYFRYGGRGIKICKRWLIFNNFSKDMKRGYFFHINKFGEKNTSIDRINNNKGYYKNNCRWTTYKQQSQNRRSNYLIIYKNETKCLAEWARIMNIKAEAISRRILRGWSTKKALETPVIIH